MIKQIDFESKNPDLTSSIALLTARPDVDNPTRCSGLIFLVGLETVAGFFELIITLNGIPFQPNPTIIDFDGSASGSIQIAPFDVPENGEVIFLLKSPNAGDNAGVTTTAYLYDLTPQIDANNRVDLGSISGDSLAADNLEATYDGTGYLDDSAPATQAAIGNLTSGSAAINVIASRFEKSGDEVETGGFENTVEEDGVLHEVEDIVATGVTDIYYEFLVGGNGVPISVTWHGYAQGQNDSYEVRAYNFGQGVWEQVGTIIASNGLTLITDTWILTNAQVGTGVNLGKVRLGFFSTDGSKIATDRILCAFAVVAQSVGYADGSIWVDTINGIAGTETYVNGVADNPVRTWADALTIAGNLGLSKFHVVNGSTILLSTDSDYYTLDGENWILQLGGQSIIHSHFAGASVSGLSSGVGFDFHDCILGDCTFDSGDFLDCGLAGDLILLSIGSTYIFEKCHSAVAGIATPSIDFGALVGDTNLNLRHYSGGIEIKNMGGAGTDLMSLEGNGQLIINTNCSAGTIAIRGLFTITDNVSGGFVSGGGTISDDARYDYTQISDSVWDAVLTGALHNDPTSAGRKLRQLNLPILLEGTSPNTGGTTNTSTRIELDSDASSMDGNYDPAIICITNGTGVGQSRQIYEYDGTNKLAYINRDWKVIPDNTSEYMIIAFSGDTHVNEGVARGGSSNTITLNTLASSVDSVYKDQVIFIVAGTGSDQIGSIISYVGSTKIATIDHNWVIQPDATSIYVMLPNAVHSIAQIQAGIATSSALATVDTNVDAIKIETDKLNSMIDEDSAGNLFTLIALSSAPTAEMDATELANAMKAITGLTEGGTWTWEKIIKITTAWIAGNWRVKSSDSSIQELMDAENGTTVILEQTLTRAPGSGSDYRTITVKI